MKIKDIKLSDSWSKHLKDEFDLPYMKSLMEFLFSEEKKGKVIYPPAENIFNALNSTPFENVKVVIIGQDPYHGIGEAHGLCFSVNKNIKMPPSVKNIFKEIEQELKLKMPNHGYLQSWADQGVLLLNSVLTVEKDKPRSHRNRGWEILTSKIIKILNTKKSNLVFILWGNDAKEKLELIDQNKHLLLMSGHPSPFSVRLFTGNNHFIKCNEYLEKNKISKINWEKL